MSQLIASEDTFLSTYTKLYNLAVDGKLNETEYTGSLQVRMKRDGITVAHALVANTPFIPKEKFTLNLTATDGDLTFTVLDKMIYFGVPVTEEQILLIDDIERREESRRILKAYAVKTSVGA